MKLISLALIVLLTGCTSIPVVTTFPKPPTSLNPPAKLKPIEPTTTELSVLLDNAAENYGSYYELKSKYEAWLEWYSKQKKIFEEVR